MSFKNMEWTPNSSSGAPRVPVNSAPGWPMDFDKGKGKGKGKDKGKFKGKDKGKDMWFGAGAKGKGKDPWAMAPRPELSNSGAPGRTFENVDWTPPVKPEPVVKPLQVPQPAPKPEPNSSPTAAAPADGLCKFFGSAKGCSSSKCSFSHANPNSVPACQFKQQRGVCDRGEACTYRHQPWTSTEECVAAYATRDKDVVEKSTQRYKQLHRGGGEAKPQDLKMKREGHFELHHVEVAVERDLQVETYGSVAVKMMEKMGFKGGTGLGKDLQGSTKLAKPCQALEQASQNCALGFGHFGAAASSSVAERAARLADARAQKRQRVEETDIVQHNLLSSDDESGEEVNTS